MNIESIELCIYTYNLARNVIYINLIHSLFSEKRDKFTKCS